MLLHVQGDGDPAVGEDGLAPGPGQRGRAHGPCSAGLTGSLRNY